VDSQQLSSKVATLEAKVAVLEDEGKIIKGEVKQILTEIRTAVLARDNPFEDTGATRPQSPAVHVVSPAAPDPVARVQIVAPEPAQAEEPEPEPVPAWSPPVGAAEPVFEPKEPIMLRPTLVPAPAAEPQWSLLTIASLTAWAEEAMRRLGALRFEILLDLCEAAGHVSPEARAALNRVKDLDVPVPEQAPSTNETVVILRQLDALLNDDAGEGAALHMVRR
jgi:hypothetical protein